MPVHVLHISTHLGGGVGKFLSGTFAYEKAHPSPFQHQVVLLERPVKTQFMNRCLSAGVPVRMADDLDLQHEIEAADLVVLHWWHHPAMAGVLHRIQPVRCRLVLWAHVSGCTYPLLPARLALLPHKTIFTTAYSLENPSWSDAERASIRQKSAVIYGLGIEGVPDGPVSLRKPDGFFNIGYVGTLNESKLHPDYMRFCAAALQKIPCAKFILVGDSDGSGRLKAIAEKMGIAEHVEFTGYTEAVDEQLNRFDVFGYPLNPYHFGTTENAVIEAMANGLPVVLLNQCTEKYMVEDGKDGILASSETNYASRILHLYQHSQERLRIGENAKKRVYTQYAIGKNVSRMHAAFQEVLALPRQTFNFDPVLGKSPHEWLLSCMDGNKAVFQDSLEFNLAEDSPAKSRILSRVQNCPAIFRGKGKGSILQYAENFPQDPILSGWKAWIEAAAECVRHT